MTIPAQPPSPNSTIWGQVPNPPMAGTGAAEAAGSHSNLYGRSPNTSTGSSTTAGRLAEEIARKVFAHGNARDLDHVVSLLELPEHYWKMLHRMRHDRHVKRSSLLAGLWNSSSGSWKLVERLREDERILNNFQHLMHELKSILAAQQPQHHPHPSEGSGRGASPSMMSRSMYPFNQPENSPSALYGMGDMPWGTQQRSQSTLSLSSGGNPHPASPMMKDCPKTAPKGWKFQCPSRYCKRTFKKVGHYENHLHKQHPDYIVSHPDHQAKESLTRTQDDSTDADVSVTLEPPPRRPSARSPADVGADASPFAHAPPSHAYEPPWPGQHLQPGSGSMASLPSYFPGSQISGGYPSAGVPNDLGANWPLGTEGESSMDSAPYGYGHPHY